MLRILIAADMEGISGVVNWDQVTPGNPEYERFRKIMTSDVNAAIKGAIQTGAEDVIVTDGHDHGTSLLLEDLDNRARLNTGSPSPNGMVQGIDQGVNAVMLVGYHARAGSANAILDHTMASKVTNVWLNGKLCGEIGLNASLCGHFNVPVVMLSGDQAAAAEAIDLVQGIEVAVVKAARGRNAAECLPLELSHQKIREAAARAVSRIRAEVAPLPYRVEAPILMTVEFYTSVMADRAGIIPGVVRLDGRRVQFTAEDMPNAFRFFRTAIEMAGN